MSSIYDFIIYERRDPVHPYFAQQSADTSAISYIDAYTYMNQAQTNTFVTPCINLNYSTNSLNIVEIQTSNVFYPILTTSTDYNYIVPYTFFLSISPKGKRYYYAVQIIDSDWNWGETYNISTNSFLYVYSQPWSLVKNPYENVWYLDKIVFNPPSPPTIELLQQNQSHVIKLFETYTCVFGSQLIPFSLSPIFCTHYDVDSNRATQAVFPVCCSATPTTPCPT